MAYIKVRSVGWDIIKYDVIGLIENGNRMACE